MSRPEGIPAAAILAGGFTSAHRGEAPALQAELIGPRLPTYEEWKERLAAAERQERESLLDIRSLAEALTTTPKLTPARRAVLKRDLAAKIERSRVLGELAYACAFGDYKDPVRS